MGKKASIFKRISAFIIAAAFLIALIPVGAVPVYAEEPAQAQGSTNFVRGLVPEKYTLTYPIPTPTPIPRGRMVQSASDASYDGRSLSSPVKNQGVNGLCWAFATYGMVEANMIKNGQGVQDLSELHMAYATSNVSNNNADQGFDRTPADGGNRYFAASYLMRGTNLSGTVAESEDPYVTTTLPVRDLSITQGKPKNFTVKDIIFISGEDKVAPTVIKQAIDKYGAVGASMYWYGNATASAGAGNTTYYNSANKAYNYDQYLKVTYGNEVLLDTNHGVLIVGWDDDFAADKFNADHRPTSNGAWLVKNSWDTNWGDQGYFWISYEDTNFPLDTYVVDGVEPYDAGKKVYENEYKWEGASFGWETTKSYANVFTVGSGNEGVSFVKVALAHADTTVSIDVISDFTSFSGYTFVPKKTVIFTNPGWYTIQLDAPVALGAAGSKFAVVVNSSENIGFGSPASTGSYCFNPNGSGSWEQDTTKTYTIKAVTTDITDSAIVAAAKAAVEGGTYTVAQNVANTDAAVKTWLVKAINDLLATGTSGITVAEANITAISVTPAATGTLSDADGEAGSFSFTVSLTKGAETAAASKTGAITATPHNPADDNAIAAAKALILAATYTVAQTEANDAASVKTWLLAKINGLTGFADTGVAVVAGDITVSSITPAVAGTKTAQAGAAGVFGFTVKLNEGIGTEVTVTSSGTITATAYDATDDDAVAAAKTAIEGGTYTVEQNTANTEAAVKTWLVTAINDLLKAGTSDITVAEANITFTSFDLAVAGAKTVTATNGSFSFTVSLIKGVGADTATKAGVITATAYDATDDLAVDAAKTAIEGGTYTVTQNEANTEAAVKAWLFTAINDLLKAGTSGITVTEANITVTSIGPAVAGAKTVTAANGSFDFTVNLSRGSGADTATANGVITATAYDPVDDNAIADAKAIILAATYEVTQAEANNEASVKTWLLAKINGLTGFAGTGVEVDAADIAVSNVKSAVAGTKAVPDGAAGSFDFAVNLEKGKGDPDSAAQSGTITAKPYDPANDNAIEAAKNAIEAGAYSVPQGTANDVAAIGSWLVSEINAILSAGTSRITIGLGDIVLSNVVSAVEGIVSNPTGNPGSFSFVVNVRKGDGTPVDTASIAGVITAEPYDPADDNAIAAAKVSIEDGTYSVPQETANEESAIKAWLVTELNGILVASGSALTVSLGDITVSDVVAAEAGTVSNQAGADGSFKFVVNVKTGKGTPVDTALLDGAIVALPYDTAPDNADIAAAKAAIEGGSYTVAQASANTLEDVRAWLAEAINAILSAGSTGISVAESDITVSGFIAAIEETDTEAGVDGSFSFIAAVAKGGGTPDVTSLKSGVVKFTAIVPDDDDFIRAAKEAIEGGTYSVPQASANDESAIKAWLADAINAILDAGDTEIRVTAADISVSALVPAIAGTQASNAGTDGSFQFAVTVSKGTGTPVSASKSGAVKATAYDGPAIGAAITTPATLDSKTHDSITVNPALASLNPGTQAIEYAIAESGATPSVWQSAVAFSGLSPETAYVVWARSQAKAGYDAGEAVASEEIVTDAAPVYVISFDPNGGSVTPETGETNASGKLLELPIPTRSGYSFDGWFTEASGGTKVTVDDIYSADATIYAHWTQNSDSSGGYVYVPSYPSVTVPTQPTKSLPAADGKVQLPYVQSGGIVDLQISASAMDEIIREANGGTATLDASGVSGALAVTLASKDLEKLANLSVEVKFPVGSVTLDAKAVTALISNPQGDTLRIVVNGAKTALTNSQIQVIGSRPSYDISVFKGSLEIKEFGGGILGVSIPYVLKPGESASRLAVYHVSADGKREKVDSSYDVAAKKVNFKTAHLSTYYIGYDEWINIYSDVTQSAWYYNAVKYVSENGLFSGTDKGFEPEVSMTRAMLVTVLYNYAKPGKGVSGNPFSDVPAGQWYSDPIAWGAANGIVSGYDGKFRPNDPVTRQESFVVLRQFAKLLGKEPVELWTNKLGFADAKEVAGWAQESAVWATMKGIVSGKPGNLLDPKGTATRAEMATMLMKFIENVI